jgi:hypothetical protein
MLTHDVLKGVLDYYPDSGIFKSRNKTSKKPAGSVVGCIGTHGYLVIAVKGRSYLAHRLAWFYMHGEWPKDLIDHVNGVKVDNRFVNLRECSKSQNGQNSKARKSFSGVKSVEWHTGAGKWRVRMEVAGKRHHIGFFVCLEQAEQAAIAARERLHGEFARHA